MQVLYSNLYLLQKCYKIVDFVAIIKTNAYSNKNIFFLCLSLNCFHCIFVRDGMTLIHKFKATKMKTKDLRKKKTKKLNGKWQQYDVEFYCWFGRRNPHMNNVVVNVLVSLSLDRSKKPLSPLNTMFITAVSLKSIQNCSKHWYSYLSQIIKWKRNAIPWTLKLLNGIWHMFRLWNWFFLEFFMCVLPPSFECS